MTTNTPKIHSSRMTFRRPAAVTSALLFAVLSSSLTAQEARSSKSDDERDRQKNDAAVELPTFAVSTKQDKGYRAGNSVSGTRIDTPIKDLPFAVNAFTQQFITDIGARNLSDIVAYAPGVTSGARQIV